MLLIIVSLVIILGAIGAFTFYITRDNDKRIKHNHG